MDMDINTKNIHIIWIWILIQTTIIYIYISCDPGFTATRGHKQYIREPRES